MKKTLALVIIISLATMNSYIVFEPEIVKGVATSTLTTISLTVTGEITLSCSATATFPDIAGQTGGTATTTFNCTTTTNNNAGYNLKLKKNQKLQITDEVNKRFDDYTTSTAYTDWNWTAVGDGNEKFGFNIVSCASTTDIHQNFRDNGSECATSTSVTAWHCFAPIPTNPAEETVANRSTATPVGGILVVFGLEAQAGGSNNLQTGAYTCTTTATATTN